MISNIKYKTYNDLKKEYVFNMNGKNVVASIVTAKIVWSPYISLPRTYIYKIIVNDKEYIIENIFDKFQLYEEILKILK